MTMLEDQIAALLKAAPGEPPVSFDADTLLDAQAPRRRLLAPLLVAAVVAAIAVAVAVATSHRPASHAAKPAPPTIPASEPRSKIEAIAFDQRALANVALPPGAQLAERRIVVHGASSSDGSPNEVHRLRTWTAAGTLEEAIAFVKAHPPAGLRFDCVCGGPHPGPRWMFFRSDQHHPVEVDYNFQTYRGGVAIQVDAWTVWIPTRPDWSYVAGSLTSVDVTVVRKGVQPQYAGAPTVTRTLGGAPAARLAAAFDALPVQPRYGQLGGPMLPVQASNEAVFHTAHGDVVATDATSSQITVTSPAHQGTVYLGGDLQGPVLRALGLPSDYGMTRGGPHAAGGLTLPPVSRSRAEAIARHAINAPDSAATFSTLMPVVGFENTYGVLLSTLPGDRLVWVVTVHAPARTDGGPGTAPVTRDVYSIVIDANTGTSRDDCVGCDWVTTGH
jgi:hypothetical protein